MRGRVLDWKDDRGFGFIEPESGGARLFFHISGVVRGVRRPAVGDWVNYEVTVTSDGKARAIDVGPAGLAAATQALWSKRIGLSLAALLVFPALWWLVALGKFPRPLFSVFAGLSAVTFIIYGLDKWAAKREAQRTPENTLQWCALLGGWPGALLAQQVFRHKSSKQSFQTTFWFMVVLNCIAVVVLTTPAGSALLSALR